MTWESSELAGFGSLKICPQIIMVIFFSRNRA